MKNMLVMIKKIKIMNSLMKMEIVNIVVNLLYNKNIKEKFLLMNMESVIFQMKMEIKLKYNLKKMANCFIMMLMEIKLLLVKLQEYLLDH